MPGRHTIQTSSDVDQNGNKVYRYGFQGQETDFEVKNVTGGSVNYKYRMHDPRLGRFFAVDPLGALFSWNSPYAFSENRVIDRIELEGLESAPVKVNGEYVPYPNMPIQTSIDIVEEQVRLEPIINKVKRDKETQGFVESPIYQVAEIAIGFTPAGPLMDVLSAADESTNGSYFGTSLAMVGFLPFGDFAKFLKPLKALRGAGKLGGNACMDFASDFMKHYSDELIEAGTTVKKMEINLGSGFIGTFTEQVSNTGKHQYVEVYKDGVTKIFDNLHPEGILKTDYLEKLSGFSNGRIISGDDLLDGAKIIE